MAPSLLQSQTLLNRFACNHRPEISPDYYADIKDALREVVAASDFLTCGVCADSSAEGYAALSRYLAALHTSETGILSSAGQQSEINGPIYIKYNTQTSKYYESNYPGTARGVLVCCHVSEPEMMSDMYGHLPLDLFGH
ncbi:MAG: DUF1824 family protein [Synechococcus sp.]